ncbi:hypothetical protein PRZ48_000848 [Zasmidium cellare]|uniref:Uncharacterized protein n=1 Tax=Zasmidium cellare TaxID=395010 RepID=A0ABR0EZK8_ZASCE|nr:hypothetical protein PRZ48_000848 [Zasmidium cellare]
MAFFHLLVASSVALSTAQASAIAPRDAPYAQIRFLECKDNTARAIGWNGAPPVLGQPPDEFLYHDWGMSNFLPGCDSSGVSETNNIPWTCKFPPHGRDIPFQNYIGYITYGGEGFNCFQDDVHHAFETPELGNCYSDIYCIQHEARNVSITASKGVVSILTNTTADEVLGNVNKRLNDRTCDPTPVDIGGGCSINFSCKGAGNILPNLAKVLTNIIAKQPDVFHFQVDKKNGPRVCLSPNACVDGDPTYTGNLTMPATFSLTAEGVPWPGSQEDPDLAGFMDATVSCLPPVDDLRFCNALRAAASGAALLPELGVIFGTVGLMATIACTF